MEINRLIANNLNEVTISISNDVSIGIAGLSGSGKSTFCSTIANESMKRIVTLLPKSEYRFLFGNKISSNYSAEFISELPLVFYLGKKSFSSNQRSTIGTHSGIFREIREKFAVSSNKTTEFFSFNNSIMWCNSCKGRGTTSGYICKTCNGIRYDNKIKSYKIKLNSIYYDITQINTMNMYQILEYSNDLGLSDVKIKILKNFIDLNVGYLSLDRVMSTLSGGEMVRILLAEFMAQCNNAIIIIDEISIGLDYDTLVNVMGKISNFGKNNQIWLIDHSDDVLNSTQRKIFFGPGSGKYGGNIISNSPSPKPQYVIPNDDKVIDFYNLKNLKKRNIAINELSIPKNRLITITGESGCGKSTLVNDCIVPYFKNNYKNMDCIIIGQDKNQSITSKSTIASFLDLTKRLNKYDENIFSKEIIDAAKDINNDKYIKYKFDMLLELGLGYLNLNRKVQTLSTGEFQCLHLVSRITENMEKEMILIFDEPSKGLSQNILNLFMNFIKKLLEDKNKTIIFIEHNSYFLACSDYIIDFGKRTDKIVRALTLENSKEWIINNLSYRRKHIKLINSKININNLKGIYTIKSKVDDIFEDYQNKFKGGILKNFSQTAQWIYSDYINNEISPIIAIDLEKSLYSKNTFLYEIAGTINSIIRLSNSKDIELFDLYSIQNLCECCKGTGKINTINIDTIINDNNKGLWDGLLHEDVMSEIKRYNYSKIKFLFKEIKKEVGYDLNKSYSDMNENEKNIFLYGYWDKSFYDTNKKTYRKWKGLIYIIIKYMRTSKSILKNIINDTSKEITCPICNGSIIKHKQKLKINGIEIRDIITKSIKDNQDVLIGIDRIDRIINILGDKINLNADVSNLPLEKQVQLKVLEIEFANLQGFEIVLKNVAPFLKSVEESINKISKNNKVIILDYDGINITKKNIIDTYFRKGKIKYNSYVYEILGYSKINTAINKIRKEHYCQYCKGRKVLREESIFDGVDVTETPCHACQETGINDIGLLFEIEGISVIKWLNGNIGDLVKNIPKNISDIKLISKISELNKFQLINLKKYMEERE